MEFFGDSRTANPVEALDDGHRQARAGQMEGTDQAAALDARQYEGFRTRALPIETLRRVEKSVFGEDAPIQRQSGFSTGSGMNRYGNHLTQTHLVNFMGLKHQHFDAAIVDLDGTMVDTVGDFEVALARALADLGWPPVGRDFISRTVGKGSEHLLTRTLAEVGAPADLYEQAWARYQHHYQRINGQHSAVFPGVVEGLRALRARGWRLACLTNKPTAFARPLLKDKGLSDFFDAAFGGDAFERKKPDPLPLLKTCEALGTTPARTLMIGDSSNDAQAARAAGLAVVLVSYGYNHGEPVASAGADAVVDRIDEIGRLLLQV